MGLEDGKDYEVVSTPIDHGLADEPAVDKPIQGCSIPFMLIFCAPKMAMNMAWAAQSAALGPLLQILLPSSWVQVVQLVGPTTGLLVAPTVGVLSDACASKYGRRRPFILCGAITSALCWLVMMHTVDIGEALGDTNTATINKYIVDNTEDLIDRKWTTVFTVLCYIWMDITCNLTQVPVNLITADFAGDHQVTAASIGGAYSIAGSFAVSGYILIFGAAHKTIKSFMTMLIVIMLVTTMAVVIFVKETAYVPVVARKKGAEIKAAFGAVWTGIRLLPYTLAVYAICLVLMQYGYTTYNGAKGQFFGLVVKNGISTGAEKCGDECNQCRNCESVAVARQDQNPNNQRQIDFSDGVQIASGTTDTIYNCGSLLWLAVLPYLVRKFGAKNVITYSTLPQVLLILMAICKNIPVNIIIIILCGITQNTINTLQIPTIMHVVGHEVDNNLRLFAGAFNSANCLGQFLNFAFSSLLVKSDMGYALPVLVGGILTFIALIIAFFKLDLKMNTM